MSSFLQGANSVMSTLQGNWGRRQDQQWPQQALANQPNLGPPPRSVPPPQGQSAPVPMASAPPGQPPPGAAPSPGMPPPGAPPPRAPMPVPRGPQRVQSAPTPVVTAAAQTQATTPTSVGAPAGYMTTNGWVAATPEQQARDAQQAAAKAWQQKQEAAYNASQAGSPYSNPNSAGGYNMDSATWNQINSQAQGAARGGTGGPTTSAWQDQMAAESQRAREAAVMAALAKVRQPFVDYASHVSELKPWAL